MLKGRLRLMEPVFQLENVTAGYDFENACLRGICLSILEGEKVAIVGANGSGKSTLLKVLDGLLFPIEGVVKAFGMDLSESILQDEAFSLAFRRKVGFVFQDPDVQLFSPTVWDEVAFGPLQLGLKKSEIAERVESTLELLEIQKLAERAPYRLSGGEKRKVALAAVLAIEPEVLLLDEPTSNLDPRSQLRLVDFLVELHRSGKTIITATHDLDIIEEIADRVLVLGEDNTLIENTTSRALLTNRDLLLRTNLIHEHAHEHGTRSHSHLHGHLQSHEHRHEKQ